MLNIHWPVAATWNYFWIESVSKRFNLTWKCSAKEKKNQAWAYNKNISRLLQKISLLYEIPTNVHTLWVIEIKKKLLFLFPLLENEINLDNFPAMEISWPKFLNFIPLKWLHERRLELVIYMLTSIHSSHLCCLFWEQKNIGHVRKDMALTACQMSCFPLKQGANHCLTQKMQSYKH